MQGTPEQSYLPVDTLLGKDSEDVFNNVGTRVTTANIWCVDPVNYKRLMDSIGNHLGVFSVTQMIQHIDASVQHSDWVGDVLSSY